MKFLPSRPSAYPNPLTRQDRESDIVEYGREVWAVRSTIFSKKSEVGEGGGNGMDRLVTSRHSFKAQRSLSRPLRTRVSIFFWQKFTGRILREALNPCNRAQRSFQRGPEINEASQCLAKTHHINQRNTKKSGIHFRAQCDG